MSQRSSPLPKPPSDGDMYSQGCTVYSNGKRNGKGTSFDSEGNNFFTGDALTIIGPGNGFDGGDSDEDGWWHKYPDRR